MIFWHRHAWYRVSVQPYRRSQSCIVLWACFPCGAVKTQIMQGLWTLDQLETPVRGVVSQREG